MVAGSAEDAHGRLRPTLRHEARLPLLADYGHELVGLYEVLMTDVEVLTIWATDPAGHEALMRAGDERRDERIAKWHEQARAAGCMRWREELMTPHPDTLLSRGDSL